MRFLKQICAVLMVAAFVVNPVAACCDMSQSENPAEVMEMTAAHDCEQMRASTSEADKKQTSEVDYSAHKFMDCEGCADCLSFERLAQSAGQETVVPTHIDVETVNFSLTEVQVHDRNFNFEIYPPPPNLLRQRTLVHDKIKLTV